ncbi:MAG: NADH-quinone oxidoreductase subunit C [PVC group bacterium]
MNIPELKEALDLKFLDEIVSWAEKNPQRVYLEVKPAALREVAGEVFHQMGARFAIASAVQTLEGFQILYHFSFDGTGVILSLRVRLGKENPEVDSISDLVPAANWIEREMGELFGITFKGRPDLQRLLLDEEWPEGVYPLRKDYGKEGNRIKE